MEGSSKQARVRARHLNGKILNAPNSKYFGFHCLSASRLESFPSEQTETNITMTMRHDSVVAPSLSALWRVGTLLAAMCCCCSSFQLILPTTTTTTRRTPLRSVLCAASSDSSEEGQQQQQLLPPNLVNKDLFVKAIDTLMEAAGQEAPSQTADNKDKGYAIGKLTIELPIIGDPGLDMAEADGLVLVTGVGQGAADAGVRTLDTVTAVRLYNSTNSSSEQLESADSSDTTRVVLLDQDCPERPLAEIGPLIVKAAGLAVENGLTTIQLDLNRLIRGYYQKQ